MRRRQFRGFRGFWSRAATGTGWSLLSSQLVICWLLILVGGAIALDFGGLWRWVVFWGIPCVLFFYWWVLAWMKWDRR